MILTLYTEKMYFIDQTRLPILKKETKQTKNIYFRIVCVQILFSFSETEGKNSI